MKVKYIKFKNSYDRQEEANKAYRKVEQDKVNALAQFVHPYSVDPRMHRQFVPNLAAINHQTHPNDHDDHVLA